MPIKACVPINGETKSEPTIDREGILVVYFIYSRVLPVAKYIKLLLTFGGIIVSLITVSCLHVKGETNSITRCKSFHPFSNSFPNILDCFEVLLTNLHLKMSFSRATTGPTVAPFPLRSAHSIAATSTMSSFVLMLSCIPQYNSK